MFNLSPGWILSFTSTLLYYISLLPGSSQKPKYEEQRSSSWVTNYSQSQSQSPDIYRPIWKKWKYAMNAFMIRDQHLKIYLSLKQAFGPCKTRWNKILTVGKSQTNAINVIMHHLRQAIWGHILKHTVEKSQTNATDVTIFPLRRMIWELIWKNTLEINQTSATTVIMPHNVHVISGDI